MSRTSHGTYLDKYRMIRIPLLEPLDMAFKIELRIEYHTKMFMLHFDRNFGPTEKHQQMDNCIFSLGKDNLHGLFAFARIKLHLQLVGTIKYDIKISI